MVATELVEEKLTQSPYSENHIRGYFQRIKYPLSSDEPLPEPTYSNLKRIFSHHIRSLPFGALDLVYYRELDEPLSDPVDILNPFSTRGIRTDPASIYRKLVVDHREGCCLELNTLLYYVMVYLGYNCYPTGGRLVDFIKLKFTGIIDYLGLLHWLLIVTFDGVEYLVDGGYGSPGPLDLLPIAKPDKMNLNHRVNKVNHCLFLESYIPATNSWRPLYAFQASRFELQDMKTIGFTVARSPDVSFQRHLILGKFTDDGSIALMDNKITYRDHSRRIYKTITMSNEQERRAAFLEHFGVKIDPTYTEHLPFHYMVPYDSPWHQTTTN